MSSFYLMESEEEAERLLIKSNREKTTQQLIATGLLSLKQGATMVDAGSGVGHIAEMMGEALKERLDKPSIILLDLSQKRLLAAKTRLDSDPQVDYQYLTCDLTRRIPLPSNSIDYVCCRFVFEYLSDQPAAFRELYRILKPGGKLVIGDLDYNCMSHYPLDVQLEKQLLSLMKTLQEHNLFDPYAGRRLYSFFHQAEMENIRVHFYVHHLFYGDLSATDEFNWLAKVDRMIEHQKKGTIIFDFDVEAFKEGFMEFLKSPDRFSYTPLILVEGRKPNG